jgi:predicted metal-dependent HD superfamily phosphohydrolase
MLKASWKRCWNGLNAQGEGLYLMEKLVSSYLEPQRKYHTIQHLSECLSLLSHHIDLAIEPAEVEVAVWFHDAIYNVKIHDNEEFSADWAVAELSKARIATERVERIRQLILATRHMALPEGQDQMLLVDIDLSILGASRVRFEEYEAQVRAEYAWVPETIYRQKRAGILSEFLARKPIYSTSQLRKALEGHARENLVYSLHQLRNGE